MEKSTGKNSNWLKIFVLKGFEIFKVSSRLRDFQKYLVYFFIFFISVSMNISINKIQNLWRFVLWMCWLGGFPTFDIFCKPKSFNTSI